MDTDEKNVDTFGGVADDNNDDTYGAFDAADWDTNPQGSMNMMAQKANQFESFLMSNVKNDMPSMALSNTGDGSRNSVFGNYSCKSNRFEI